MSTSQAEKRARYRGFESVPIPLKVRVGWARVRLGRLAELNPDAHHAQIAGAGHVVLQTQPSKVAEALRDFLKDA